MRDTRIMATVRVLCAAAISGWLTSGSVAAVAQTPARTDTDRLATQLHLADGERTLAALAQEVSAQTGLQIDVQECIRDHRVSAWLDGASALEALDAVAALNDWQFRQTAPGRFAILRKPLMRPTNVGAIPAALSAALPRDFRSYAGLVSRSDDGRSRRHGGFRHVFDADAARHKAELLSSLKEGHFLAADRLPYDRLSLEQRHLLMASLVIEALDGLSEILSGQEGMYQMAPEKATIHLDKYGVMLVDEVFPSGATGGFGKNVKRP